MSRWAIYRIHYGLDFLKQSIDSIIDSVDHVFVVYSKEPWHKSDTVYYMGRECPMPSLHEDVQAFMEEHYFNTDKVHWCNKEVQVPNNQFKNYFSLVEDNYPELESPEHVLFMEPDMVFNKKDIERAFVQLKEVELPCFCFTQIELWKDHHWRVPQRDRVGPTIWKTKELPKYNLHFGTYANNAQFKHEIQNYNFGFCMNAKTMLYKHLTAINFSSSIGDSIPSHEWYTEKWLKWTPAVSDLEIAEKWKHLIPKALSYEMPEDMRIHMGYFD